MVRGNLLEEPVDAIVNAANGHLAHGGGVAAVIARAAGPALQEESDRIVRERGPFPPGSAVATYQNSVFASPPSFAAIFSGG